MQRLFLDHFLQRLVAATLQSSVDQTTMCPPLLCIVPQRDGAPSTWHNITWDTHTYICKYIYIYMYLFNIYIFIYIHLCMILVSQQSQTISSPVLLWWGHCCSAPPWLVNQHKQFFCDIIRYDYTFILKNDVGIDLITCVSTFKTINVPVASCQLSQVNGQMVVCQLHHVPNKKETTRTWDGRRWGTRKKLRATFWDSSRMGI